MITVDFSAPPIPGHGIRDGYTHRERPEYFHDLDDGVVWQPDVYTAAAAVAQALDAARIIDVGCGSGHKLMDLQPLFDVIGIDFGANLEGCRERWPAVAWRGHDLEDESPLPVAAEELEGSVLVSSDVIEHLVRPELLVRKLALGLRAGARAVVISTPERERTTGAAQMGPPVNVAHVREWTQGELAQFLESEGLEHGDMLLTRSNDLTNALETILAVLVADEADASTIRAAGVLPTR